MASKIFLALMFFLLNTVVVADPTSTCSTSASSCSEFKSCCRSQCHNSPNLYVSCATSNGQIISTSCGCGDNKEEQQPQPSPPIASVSNAGQCGIRPSDNEQTRIVGGTEAAKNSWPWQASLRVNGRHICGGSLIDPLHILTAAHCVIDQRPLEVYKVVLGAHAVRSRGETTRQTFDVASIAINPNHRGNSNSANSYDSAVIKLSRPVTYTNAISPVCLAQQDVPPETNCYVTGWGVTEGTGDNKVLQEVRIPILAMEKCNRADLWDGQVDQSMICAGTPGHDTCRGDSGGPLVCKRSDGRWEQHGIVSWGLFQCARKPGVYGRVTAMRTWVEEQMNL